MHLGLFILAAFCVFTGIFAPNLIFFIGTLLSGAYALDYVLGAITRTWDFHPLENAHTERT